MCELTLLMFKKTSKWKKLNSLTIYFVVFSRTITLINYFLCIVTYLFDAQIVSSEILIHFDKERIFEIDQHLRNNIIIRHHIIKKIFIQKHLTKLYYRKLLTHTAMKVEKLDLFCMRPESNLLSTFLLYSLRRLYYS